MAIRNPAYFQDNYYSGEAAKIFMEIKNDNSFDLHLRLGFTDFEGSKIVFTEPTIIPANTGAWSIVEFETSPQFFSLIEGENSIAEVLTNVSEMWIIHNPEISFNGAYENGDFEIDTIGTIYLLGTDDFKTQNVNIYPIPTKNILHIESKNSSVEYLEIYDSLGRLKKSQSENLTQIDLSDFSNGVYFLKLISGSEIQTKKIIKK
ncbi:Por secretion system C-terminal sorting domain-containing protein [Aequorivita viscosa]|uniref:Por secretion system C-terminal sorting domain-containing protein n=2 Tax=Aequorivita viscosa TaxID=797419 RepID=A0A1M6FBI2_9FLAO|nr:Por secretion system C-terminal sorting domain-containing protein [Aequorivita viscosa]SHI95104.1 Por secretion system C-terminal sorting domain-containing protein [Aequorivita viscosa]